MSRASSAATAGAAAAATAAVLRRWEPPVAGWRRRNYRDRTVTLAAGPAVGAGVVAAGVAARAPGAVIAGLAGGALGLYDDLYGDSHARGLRGHVRALRHGRVTTGMVKLAGLAAGGVLAGAATRPRSAHGLVGAGVDGALVAGAANLVNLLDLRPGRALKVAVVVASATAAARGPQGAVAAGVTATALALIGPDLREREMIGDCGANAAGAVLGWCLATGAGRSGRVAALAVIVALTLASERVSFTEVIDRSRWLGAADRWGRR